MSLKIIKNNKGDNSPSRYTLLWILSEIFEQIFTSQVILL